ncbi:membrane-bound lytic murein transglycosylase C [Orbus hercynius]|uniref:Membrane-bound lytic murein transglycosylase C n=1 Tax=Orbus hercynius TaxID=593135 RepID=A0A495RAZ0_9GAMM|nr:membrane-bound lytic murein transglycosylase MltC [Orbus hercynius]RKS84652.1 membrane-bound lytic murein transglycosylase C [Orbus hercynius]
MSKKITCCKILSVITLAALLNACGSKDSSQEAPIYVKDTNAFNILISQYANNIEQIWGLHEVLIAGPKDYVQYSDDLQTRTHINFVSGKLTIETLSSDPATALKSAIVTTLLMSEPEDIIKQSQSSIDVTKEPFLYKQIVDETGQPIRWEWRAVHYAQYLIDTQVKVRTSDNQKISYIVINLVPNHVNERAHKFMPLVQEAAAQYYVDEKLILAIMEVESNFNPFAVSSSDALGLMQVQQHTAGRDLYKRWGKKGEPTRAYLLEPRNNIYMGTAYLALIRDSYLAGIKNPISMRYAIITSYNGGAGSVLRTFSSDRNKAVDVINSLSPEQVYNKLVTSHVSQESRNYLIKVNRLLTK